VSEARHRAAGVSEAVESPLEVGLELPARSYGAVGRLVAAGVASRLGATVDRIDELQLALDTALRRTVRGSEVVLRLRPADDALKMIVGPLNIPNEERNELERVLSTLVEGVRTYEADGQVWLDLRVAVEPLASPSR
jgi:hypothetical protein